MFSSFQTAVPDSDALVPSSVSESTQKQSQSQRPKRVQIRKACDACRQARVKCNEVWPCRRCRDTGRKCGNETQNEFKELPGAIREIEKLRRQVKELKGALENVTEVKQQQQQQQQQQQRDQPPPKLSDAPPKTWRGVTIHNLKYGQLSLEYLIYRLCSSFGEDSLFLPVPPEPFLPLDESAANFPQPPRIEQDAYIDRFWLGVHVLLPVVDEVLFRKHYADLWASVPAHANRPADRLVDIILAVSMQPASHPAANFFFARWKAAFALNAVDFAQVQSAIVASAYFVGDWRYDEALQTVGLALRTAHMLGLPSGAFSSGDAVLNELGRRTWLVLASIENELALRLDRLPLIPLHHVPRLTDRAGSAVAADVHWLDFLNMRVELLVLTRNICTTMSSRAAAVDPTRVPRTDAEQRSREDLAAYALGIVAALRAWSGSVPRGLHLRRQDDEAAAFSTDESIPVFDGQPLWLVRQQLTLELLFHTMCLQILRPFVRTAGTKAGGPNGEAAAEAAVRHAVTVMRLIGYGKKHHELRGWRISCSMLTEAVWTCGTFAVGHAGQPMAAAARRGLRIAVVVDMHNGLEDVGGGPKHQVARVRILRVVEWLEQRLGKEDRGTFDGLPMWMRQSEGWRLLEEAEVLHEGDVMDLGL
ncbi:hypothetical protein TD95_004329 [Thielaviopsis punctulata]|uniref:Zn(2)-C6 fungal-type domain-containing protein n=1 Tax=Thielaviopsis punctulata TaxID=72032 RepID=A0A0F4ZLC8_9PEZI|nr:hypothetical protein TD95_004329 [Thielaviopsis punctulata]